MRNRKLYLFLICFIVFFGTIASYAEKNKREQLKDKFMPRNVRQIQNMNEQDYSQSQNPQISVQQEELSLNTVNVVSEPFIGEYAIYQSEYETEIEEEIAFIKARVNFEVFKKSNRVRIPLVDSNIGLKEVSLNNKPAFIIRDNNQYYLIIDKPGVYKLYLEFFVKVDREREHGPGNVSFKVLPSPIAILDVVMQEKEVEIFVEPSIKVETEKLAKKTLATVILPFTPMVTVRWSPALPKEDIPQVIMEPKMFVDTTTLVSIGDGVARCSTDLHYSILQSEVSTLRISFPEDVGILNVAGDQIRDWKVKTDQGLQTLDIYLNYGVKGEYSLNVSYEKNIGQGSVTADLPVINVVGVERQRGFAGIEALTNIELAFNKLSGASTVDVKELPQNLWSRAKNPLLLAFKYLDAPYQTVIDVTKHEEVAVLVAAIDSANYVTLFTEEGKVLTKAIYQMRNNVKQFVRLTLPEEADLWSCFVSGKPVKPAKDKDGRILIPLEKSQVMGEALNQFPVEIVYLTIDSKLRRMSRLKMNLPKLDIPQNELFWSVYLPDKYHYYKFDGDVKPLKRTFHPITAGFDRGQGLEYKKEMSPARYKDSKIRNNQLYSQTVVSDEEVGMFEGVAGARAQGVLPIKIDVPERGRMFRFSKLLITDESPWMSVSYVRIPRPGVVMVSVAVILIGSILVIVTRKPKTKAV